MDLKSLLAAIFKDHATEFNFINQETITKLSEELQKIGYNLIVNESKNPSYIPIARLNDEMAKKDLLSEQLKQQNTTIEELKKSAAGNAEMTQKITDLQNQNTDWQNKFNNLAIETAVKIAASSGDYKAKDPGDILSFVDKNKLKLNQDNTLTGLDEQLKDIKAKKPYLFEEIKQPDKGGSGGNPPANPGSGSGTGGGGSDQKIDFRTALQNSIYEQFKK